MLGNVKMLNGYAIQNTNDETVGKVEDFYIDDQGWSVCYLVASTGKWLIGLGELSIIRPVKSKIRLLGNDTDSFFARKAA